MTENTAKVYSRRVRLRAEGATGEHSLSLREREVLELMRRGMRDSEIGSELGISVRTVESHASEVLRKLGLGSRRALADPIALFSEREFTVGQLAASGLTDREIADRLGMSPRTVETHVAAVRKKIGINSRVQLQRTAELLRGAPDT